MTAAPLVDANGAAHDTRGRFTSPAWMTDTGPLPFLDRPSDLELPPLPEASETRYYAVPAPKCPHGSFARWAAKNCRRCAGLR